MKKVFLFSFGCSNRYLDGERYKLFFTKNNFLITEKLEEADYIILNTCAFRKSEEDIAMERLPEFQKRKKPEAEIIVTGCLPAINEARLRQHFTGRCLPPKDLEKIDDIFQAQVKISSIPDSNTYHFHRPKKIGELLKTLPQISKKNLPAKVFKYVSAKLFQNRVADEKDSLYYLRVVNGCLGNCSYCAIKYAIGNAKSKPLNEILAEIGTILSQTPAARIVVIGDDTGAYGLDIGLSFSGLLERLASIEGLKQIDVEEINIHWLAKDFDRISAVLNNPKFVNLLFSIQSGSARILQQMNRPVLAGPAELARHLCQLKQMNPRLRLKGQYIIGFPGETAEDLELTKQHILESALDEVNLFKFDAKPNTPAAKMPEQISEQEKDRRIRRLEKELKAKKIRVFTNN